MQQRHLAHLLEVLLRPRADAGQERLVEQGEASERVLLGAGVGAGGDRERLLSRECSVPVVLDDVYGRSRCVTQLRVANLPALHVPPRQEFGQTVPQMSLECWMDVFHR